MTGFIRDRGPSTSALSRPVKRARHRGKRSLGFDRLEDRAVPATLTWINPLGGDWDTPANWSGGHLPGSSDTAVINLPGITITHAGTTADSIQSLISNNPVILSAGSLSISSDSSIANSLTVAGGSLAESGKLTVNSLLWSGGTLSGAGSMTVGAGGINIRPTATVSIQGLTLNNTALATWTGTGSVSLNNGAVFNNLAGATFKDRSNASLIHSNSGSFLNAGTFIKMTGTGTSDMTASFTNTGSVLVQSGILQLDGGGGGTGTIDVAAGTDLNFSSGTYHLGAGAALTDTGSVNINGATVSIDAPVSAQNLTFRSGTITGTGTLVVNGVLSWTGGTMSGTGTTAAYGGMTLGGTASNVVYQEVLYVGWTLQNYAAATLATSTASGTQGLSFWNGSSLVNEPTGTFSILTDASLNNFNSGNSVVNQGTIAKVGGSGTSIIAVPFVDAIGATFSTLTGTVSLQSTTSIAANDTVTVATGATLAEDNGTTTLAAGSSIVGGGVMLIRGGALALSGGTSTISTPTLTFSAGSISGTGTLAINGALSWTGGTMSGTGTTAAYGGMTLGGTTSNVVYQEVLYVGWTLQNYAAATLATSTASGTQGLSFWNGSSLVNEPSATFSILTDASLNNFNSGNSVVNQGTFAKVGGSGTSIIAVPFVDAIGATFSTLTGTVSLQSTTSIAANDTVTVATGATLAEDYATTTLAAGSSIVGGGVMLIRGGALALSGGTSTISTPTLTFSAGSISGTGTLAVNSALSWTGGTMSGTGTTAAYGGMTLGGTTSNVVYQEVLYVGWTLQNYAAATLATSTASGTQGLSFWNGSSLVNEPSATFSILTDASLNNFNSGNSVVNQGTFAKVGGSGTSIIAVPFVDAIGATFSTLTGTVSLQSTTSIAANDTVTVATGATLAEDNGTTTLAAGSSIVGGGVMLIRGGALALSGGTSTISTPTLTFSAGSISGTGTLAINGALSWTGGTMSGTGTTAAYGGMTLGGTTSNVVYQEVLYVGWTLQNYAAATLATSTASGTQGLSFWNGSSLVNEPSATFSILTDASLNNFNSGNSVVNQGTFAKVGGSGTSIIAVPFVDAIGATFSTLTGTVSLQSTTSIAANDTVTVATGATLAEDYATTTLAAGSSIVGGGVMLIRGGALALSGGTSTISTPTLTFSAGSISGTGTLAINGALSWTGGTMSGTGTTAAYGGMTLGGTTSNVVYQEVLYVGWTLQNYAAATLATSTASGTQGLSLWNGSSLVNEPSATFSILTDASLNNFNSGNSVVNQGTFAKVGGSGTSIIAVPFVDAIGATFSTLTGTVSLQSTTSIAANDTVTVATGATLAEDNGTTTLAAGSSIVGGGVMLIRGGALALSGGTSTISTPTLTFSAGSISGTGTLAINGALSWTGGTMSGTGTTAAYGGMTLGGTTSNVVYQEVLYVGWTLQNYAAATLATSTASGTQGLSLWNGSSLVNEPSATFSILTDASLNNFNSGNSVVNQGTFAKIGGTGTTLIAVPFVDAIGATFSTLTGTISLQSNTSIAANDTVTVAAGATLAEDNGTTTLAAGSSIVGGGAMLIRGGALTLSGGTSTISTPTLTFSAGSISGTGTLAVNSALSWTGGTMSGTGTTAAYGGMTLGGTTSNVVYQEVLYVGWTLQNYAAATLATSTASGTQGLSLWNGSSLVNEPSATFSILTDASLNNFNSGNSVVNQGTFAKVGGSGTSTINESFINTGTISVLSGTLSPVAGGTSTGGHFVVASGATYLLNGDNTFTVIGTQTGTGAGTALLRSGTLVIGVGGAAFNFDPGLFQWTGGTITGGSFGNAGSMNWTGGTLGASDTINNSGALNWGGGTVPATSSIVTSGSMNWSGGTISPGATLTNSGTLTVDGPSSNILGGTLANSGTLNWTSGVITNGGSSSAVLNNQSGGTIVDQFDASTTATGTGGVLTINNFGTFRKAGGTGSTAPGTTFNNNGGTIDVRTGTFSPVGGGSDSGGTLLVSPGAVLDLSGGSSFSYSGTVKGSGGGTILLRNGSIVVSGTTFNFDPGMLQWTGGSINGTQLTITQTLHWTSGTANASITIDGPVTIDGVGTKVIQGSLDSVSSMSWTRDVITVNHGATLGNEGVFDIPFDATLAGSGTFVNNGTVEKSGGTGTLTLNPALVTTGTLIVQSGTFNPVGGGSSTNATDEVASGATLNLNGGNTFTVNGSLRGTGAGLVLLASGTVNVSSASFNFDPGLFQWTGGTIQGGNLTNLGSITIAGSGTPTLSNATLTDLSTIDWTGGVLAIKANASLGVQAGVVFEDSGGTAITSDGTGALNVQGTFLQDPAAPALEIDAAINNSGIMKFQGSTLTATGGGSSSGSFDTVAGNSLVLTAGNFRFVGASFLDAGLVDLNGASATIQGSVSAQSFEVDAGSLNSGTGSSNVLTPSVLFHWTGGTVGSYFVVSPLALTTIDGASTKTLNGTLNLVGSTTWSNGPISAGSGSTINNSGLFNTTFDGTLSGNSLGSSQEAFNNTGTLEKTGGTGSTTINSILNNSGIVSVLTGTLKPTGGGTSTNATYQVAAGATFDLNGGASLNYVGTQRGTGAGTVLLGGGSITIDPKVGATFNFDPGLMQWTGGTIQGGNLQNLGAITVAGSSAHAISDATLTNLNTILWTVGNIALNSSSEILNQAGALLEINGGATLGKDSSDDLLVNGGTIQKDNGSGTSEIDAVLNNTGLINVLGGSLALGGGGTLAAIISDAAGASLAFPAGNFLFNPGSGIAGAGAVSVSGAILDLEAAVGVQNLELDSGSIIGAGDLTAGGLLKWVGGALGGTGLLDVGPSGQLNIDGGSSYIGLRTINNEGLNLSQVPGNVFVSTDNTFNNLASYLSTTLASFQGNLDSQAFGDDLPLLGQALSSLGATQVIQHFLSPLVGAIGDLHLATLQNLIFNALGPNGLNLLSSLTGSTHLGPADVSVSNANGMASFHIRLKLGASANTANTGFDVGLPALGFQFNTNSGVALSVGYTADFYFHVSERAGQAGTFTVDPSTMNLSLQATAPGLDVKGKLGPLQVEASDDPSEPSQITGSFQVGMSSNPQGQIAMTSTFDALALVNLKLAVSFGDNQEFSPKLTSDFNVSWGFNNANTAVLPLGNYPSVAFNNVQIDLGSFFSNFVAPILSDVQQVTKELTPLADLLTAPLPVISDMTGSGTTFADLISLADPDAGEAISALADAITKINNLPSVNAIGGGMILLGSFNVTDPRQSDASGDSTPPAINGATYYTNCEAQAAQISPAAGTFFQSVASFGDATGFQFPILTNPLMAFDMLLGQKVTLFTFTLPTLTISTSAYTSFPIYPFVDGVIEGTVTARASATFGYDTSGLLSGTPTDGFFVQDANVAISMGLYVGAGIGIPDLAEIVSVFGVTGEADFTLTRKSDGSNVVRGSDFENGNLAIGENGSISGGGDIQVVTADEVLGDLPVAQGIIFKWGP